MRGDDFKHMNTNDIDYITLLSIEEYEKAKDYIPHTYNCWWLSSRGIYGAVVFVDGYVNRICDKYYCVSKEYGVRPALKIKNEKHIGCCYSPGDQIDICGVMWTVLPGDILLCNDIIGECAFRKDWRASDANDYEVSDIKKWIESWWDEKKKQKKADKE